MNTEQRFSELLNHTLTFATEREVLQQKIKKEKNEITREGYMEKVEILEEIISMNMDTIRLLEEIQESIHKKGRTI